MERRQILAKFENTEIYSLAVRDGRIVAVGNSNIEGDGPVPSIFFSDDDGATWAAESFAETPGESLFEVIATDGGFVAVAGGLDGASAWVSADGETWERVPLATSADARALAPVDGGFVAVGNVVGQDIGPVLSWTSVDGRTWESGSEFGPASIRILAVDGGGSTVVAGGQCQSDSCDSVLWIGEVSR